jgi:hypothetical protein
MDIVTLLKNAFNIGTGKNYVNTDVGANGVKLSGSTVPKSAPVFTQAELVRSALVSYRDNITSPDSLPNPVLGSLTGVTVASGVLVSATNYYVSVCALNRYGNTATITPVEQAPGGSYNAIRVPIGQVVDPSGTPATGYCVFLSTSATGPLMVLQVTEAQRATGGVCIAENTYAAGGIAGAIDIGVVGTGLASNVAPFTINTAVTVDSVTIPTINVPSGCSTVLADFVESVVDFRILPGASYRTCLWNENESIWIVSAPTTAAIPTLTWSTPASTQGVSQVKILINTIAGFGASINIDAIPY